MFGFYRLTVLILIQLKNMVQDKSLFT